MYLVRPSPPLPATAVASSLRRAPWAATVAALAVGGLALHLRWRGLRGEITWDEADYAAAAARGFWANWWFEGGIHGLRHFHGPLTADAIGVATRLVGGSVAAIRLPTMLASVVACALVVLAGDDLAQGGPMARLVAGATAGALLATAPASLAMAETAKPHPWVELFLVLNLWSLCRYLRAPTRRRAAWFGASLAGQFLAMEYATFVAAFAVIAGAVVAVRERRPARSTVEDLLLAAVACVLILLVTWPGGVLHGDIGTGLHFFLDLAERGHRRFFRGVPMQQLPWYAYLWWYEHRFPLLLVAMLGALALVAVWVAVRRTPVAIALGIFVAGFLLAIHRAHIMGLAYSTFAVTPLVLAAVLAGNWAWVAAAGVSSTRGRVGARAAVALLAVAGVLGGRCRPPRARPIAGPLTVLSRRLAAEAEPGATVVATNWPIVRHLVTIELGRADVTVVGYGSGDDAEDLRGFEAATASPPSWALVGGWVAMVRPRPGLDADPVDGWPVVASAGGYRLHHKS